MERTPDQIAQAEVRRQLAPHLKSRDHLIRLNRREERYRMAEQLAANREPFDEWVDRFDYFLAEELRTALVGPEAKRQQTKALLSLLQSDIDQALDEAIDRAVVKLNGDLKQVDRLIEDLAVELQQILLRLKQEFGGSDRALDKELSLLEEKYAMPAVDSWLRRKLCLPLIARYHQEMGRTLQKALAAFEQRGRPESERGRFEGELAKAFQEVAKRAVARIEAEGPEERVRAALLALIARELAEAIEAERLKALFE